MFRVVELTGRGNLDVGIFKTDSVVVDSGAFDLDGGGETLGSVTLSEVKLDEMLSKDSVE